MISVQPGTVPLLETNLRNRVSHWGLLRAMRRVLAGGPMHRDVSRLFEATSRPSSARTVELPAFDYLDFSTHIFEFRVFKDSV